MRRYVRRTYLEDAAADAAPRHPLPLPLHTHSHTHTSAHVNPQRRTSTRCPGQSIRVFHFVSCLFCLRYLFFLSLSSVRPSIRRLVFRFPPQLRVRFVFIPRVYIYSVYSYVRSVSFSFEISLSSRTSHAVTLFLFIFQRTRPSRSYSYDCLYSCIYKDNRPRSQPDPNNVTRSVPRRVIYGRSNAIENEFAHSFRRNYVESESTTLVALTDLCHAKITRKDNTRNFTKCDIFVDRFRSQFSKKSENVSRLGYFAFPIATGSCSTFNFTFNFAYTAVTYDRLEFHARNY